MIRDRILTIKEEFQPKAAFNNVAKISGFHRIQCSPGYREAAHYMFDRLKENGIHVEVLSYPASEGVSWWSQQSFKEWSCKDAELVLLEDGKRERLCSFAEAKTSVIQKSAPTPREGVETSIILVEDGTNPASYEGLDVKGKLVFSRGDVTTLADVAVNQFGAAGIVVDTMREHPLARTQFDLPDGRQYLSFWPGRAQDHKAFGFVISPRQGQELRKKLASGKNELRVYAKVESSFYDGTMEVVTAVIPGQGWEVPGGEDPVGDEDEIGARIGSRAQDGARSDEDSGNRGGRMGMNQGEVVAIAHLCHPESSANDNASGCGVLMEAARTLGRLVNEGRLPRPKRTIRFLWVPEMTGSYAYLASHEGQIDDIVAAINLDMVGENQELCKSIFMVEKPPRALPGFGGDLAEAILGFLTKEVGNLAGNSANATFRWGISPFSGGSDHAIWGDPTVGVTCPMLIQWPDRFYHTSEDTIDKVDPAMLALAGVITATYLHTIAMGEIEDAIFLAGEMASRFPGEARQVTEEILARTWEKVESSQSKESIEEIQSRAMREIEKRVAFLTDREIEDLESLLHMAAESRDFALARQEAKEFILKAGEFERNRALRGLFALTGSEGKEVAQGRDEAWKRQQGLLLKAQEMVPERVFRGPYSSTGRKESRNFREEMEAFRKKHPGSFPASTLQYWTDGRRTLSDIADLVEGETGFNDLEAILEYVELMAKHGVYRIKMKDR